MGLDTTHGAFHGAYSAFNRFRQVIAEAAGGSYPPHKTPLIIGGEEVTNPDDGMWYVPDWDEFQIAHPGLSAFFVSNDCEGQFSPETCKQMADEIEALLPEIKFVASRHIAAGHLERDGGYVKVAERYIAGCRAAHAANEALEYR